MHMDLPHLVQGSCPVRPPAGRGQSGALNKAVHSPPAPAPSAAARLRWRTRSGLRGVWLEQQRVLVQQPRDVTPTQVIRGIKRMLVLHIVHESCPVPPQTL